MKILVGPEANVVAIKNAKVNHIRRIAGRNNIMSVHLRSGMSKREDQELDCLIESGS